MKLALFFVCSTGVKFCIILKKTYVELFFIHEVFDICGVFVSLRECVHAGKRLTKC